MASDIKISFDNDLEEGDVVYNNGDLLREEGLETAVWMSIFTDRRADEYDTLPDPLNGDRRGWWGDMITTYDNEKIGSRLWLLERSKTTEVNLNLARFYIEEALEWMLADGVAQALTVTVERQNRQDGTATLACQVEIRQSSGSIVTFKYDDLWKSEVA